MLEKTPCILALIMFHETRHTKAKKSFIVLSCVIYIITDNFPFIYYIACQSYKLSEICVDGKYLVKYFNKFLGIGIPYFLMNLFLCHGFRKNIKYIFILKYPIRMLEYYFSKRFGILERNPNNLKKIPNLAKQKIHAEEAHDSDYVMTFITTTISISNTLNKLWLQSSLHSSYIQTKYNGKEERKN